MAVLTLALALLCGGGAAPGAAAPPAAVDPESCDAANDEVPVQTTSASVPLGLLRIADAQAVMAPVSPGTGINVAVVDSGVSTKGDHYTVVESFSTTTIGEVLDPQGTAMASLIAGAPRADDELLGIAPGAGIVDVRVYDQPEDGDQGEQAPTPDNLAAGLQWVAANAARLDIKIAAVGVITPPSEELEAAVKAVHAAGVILVVSAGSPTVQVPPEVGVDMADRVFPAGYQDQTVAVNVTGGGSGGLEPPEGIFFNSATDVAAPTFGAVVGFLNGSTCDLMDIRPTWATAEVAGILAMVWSRFPRENAAQITHRVLATASGTLAAKTTVTGAGVVQPLEAMTRPITPAADGEVHDTKSARDQQPRVRVPSAEPDTMARIRHQAVWAALIGGSVLLLALMLRPMVMRRRPPH